MRVSDFDYNLPPNLIAQSPVEPRDAARLLVVQRQSEDTQHRIFHDLPQILRVGDVLVLNNSRVLPARLFGKRASGADAEILLLCQESSDVWTAYVRPGKRIQHGDALEFGDGRLTATVVDVLDEGERRLRFVSHDGTVLDSIHALGAVPLPPYIHEALEDGEQYQTVYADPEGSIAAPTAGLHFTPELLTRLAEMGIEQHYVTLHVGAGTFKPVIVDEISDHKMHSEWAEVSAATADAIRAARREGRRIVAVGTTTLRTLESAAHSGEVTAFSGLTDIFITPGYEFRGVDALITNFHVPKSTLLMLVSALAGKDVIDRAYAEAIEREYRFLSFGDAMLIE